jgi:hypothetical protein
MGVAGLASDAGPIGSPLPDLLPAFLIYQRSLMGSAVGAADRLFGMLTE